MNTDVMFSSKREDWETPPELFKKYDDIYRFNLDVCANRYNAKVSNFYDVSEIDALTQPWEGRCWCNPPYGRGIEKWVKKAHDEVFEEQRADLVFLLLPSRTDTIWFHKYIYNPRDFDAAMGTKYRFLKGRVKFLEDGKPSDPAPFPSLIVLMRREEMPF